MVLAELVLMAHAPEPHALHRVAVRAWAVVDSVALASEVVDGDGLFPLPCLPLSIVFLLW